MIDKDQLTKRYYNISEVARLFGVTNSLLRYWEGEFKTIQPVKGRNGIRRYTKEDIEKIEKVYDLVKVRGFTIDGAKKELKRSRTVRKSTKSNLLLRLQNIKKRLETIRASLDDE